MKRCLPWVLCLVFVLTAGPTTQTHDPLPSWNEGASKQAITRFVDEVTTAGGPNFVPPAERIAVFDNDGTLWAEQPVYFQFVFAIDRVKALAPQHPEWKEKQPFKGALEGDLKAIFSGDKHALFRLVAARLASLPHVP